MFQDLIYANYIDRIASEKKNEEFYNSNSEHATIVLSAMFRYASNEVNVFCTDLTSDVSNSDAYLIAVESFLEKGGKINALLTDYKADEFPTKRIHSLLSKHWKQVVLKTTNKKIIYRDNAVNFTVADGTSFRFETDIENRKAKGNFNDPEEAKILNNVFNQVFLAEDSNRVLLE